MVKLPVLKETWRFFMFITIWEDTQDTDNKHMGIEVRVLHYAFSSNNDDALNNTIFSDYAVIE